MSPKNCPKYWFLNEKLIFSDAWSFNNLLHVIGILAFFLLPILVSSNDVFAKKCFLGSLL